MANRPEGRRDLEEEPPDRISDAADGHVPFVPIVCAAMERIADDRDEDQFRSASAATGEKADRIIIDKAELVSKEWPSDEAELNLGGGPDKATEKIVTQRVGRVAPRHRRTSPAVQADAVQALKADLALAIAMAGLVVAQRQNSAGAAARMAATSSGPTLCGASHHPNLSDNTPKTPGSTLSRMARATRR